MKNQTGKYWDFSKYPGPKLNRDPGFTGSQELNPTTNPVSQTRKINNDQIRRTSVREFGVSQLDFISWEPK